MQMAVGSDARVLMEYDIRRKSMVLAYLLWWFLGTLGAHRFYLGRTGSAVAMLIITLISFPLALLLIGYVGFALIGVWWLVDAFLIPGMVRSHNVRVMQVLSGGRA